MNEFYIFIHDKYEIIISRYCRDLMKLTMYYMSMIMFKLSYIMHVKYYHIYQTQSLNVRESARINFTT